MALGALGSSLATPAHAANDDVILLPTALVTRRTADEPLVLHQPGPDDGRTLLAWTRQIDVMLGEAAQDLGLTMDVSNRASTSVRDLSEDALLTQAHDSWVVSPRLEIDAGKVRLRLVAVAPGTRVLLVRSQEIDARDAELRAMVMMRDVIQTGRGSPQAEEPEVKDCGESAAIVKPARSPGRAVLALNAAALGGYIGYTLQRAGGSDDARLTYPLIALGTGLGLGGATIVADEWDVGLGDAWFLSAGAFWPGAAGFLIADGYQKHPKDSRFVYSVIGASAGITLATTALTFEGMGEGGALLAHSGGAFGMLLGGVAQLAYEGTTDTTPSRGMGFGAAIGVVTAGALASQFELSPSRVLLIDLGASLGALTGAAAASPLLIVEDQRKDWRDRAWLGTVALGTLVGGGIGWFLTREQPHKAKSKHAELTFWPDLGPIGESVTPNGQRAPVFGAALRGVW